MAALTKRQTQAWKDCWKTFALPDQGIRMAWAFGVSVCMRDNEPALLRGSGKTPWFSTGDAGTLMFAGRRNYVVHWLGWGPDRGLLTSDVPWNLSGGYPDPTAAEWTDLAAVAEGHPIRPVRYATNPAWTTADRPGAVFRLLGYLPYPMDNKAAAPSQFDVPTYGQLMNALMMEALSSMPGGTAECLDILSNSRLLGLGLPPQVEMLDWLLGADPTGYVGKSTAGSRRRQFVLSHPAVAMEAMISRMLTNAVDDGRQPFPVAAGTLKVSQPTMRLLASLPSDTAKSVRLRDPDNANLLALLEAMDASWLPAVRNMDDRGWRSVQALAKATKENGGEPGPVTRAVAASLRPERGSLAWVGELGPGLDHLMDMSRAMACDLVLPALARGNERAQIGPMNIDDLQRALLCLGVRKLDRALRTHIGQEVDRARLGAAACYGEGDDEDGWGRAAPDAVGPGGQAMRFLASQADLDREGSALDHCVGSYGEKCSQRACAILSIGRWCPTSGGPWQPSSTVEFVLRAPAGGDTGILDVVQHMGPGNDRPPKADQDALAWWRAEHTAGRIILHEGALLARQGYSASAEDLPYRLGAAWRTPEAHAHRWNAWRRILDVRSPCFSDWLLSLPSGYMQTKRCERLVTAAADMDEEMDLAAQLEDMDATLQPPAMRM